MNRFNRTKPQNHIRNLEQRTKRNVNRSVNKNITNYFREERAQQNNRNHHQHHKHHHNRRPNRHPNRRNNRNSYGNRQLNSSNNSDNSVHLQFLPLYIYIFFTITAILAQFTNEKLSKIMEREWREHKLAVSLMYMFKLLWIVVIYMLCANHYNKTAWFLVLLPLIVFTLFILTFVYIFASGRAGTSGM